MPSSDTQSPLSRLGLRLVSPAALYDDWVIAETETALALDAWREATAATKAGTFAAYQHALDHEARAAERLACRLRAA